jgi:hypothetical protein
MEFAVASDWLPFQSFNQIVCLDSEFFVKLEEALIESSVVLNPFAKLELLHLG